MLKFKFSDVDVMYRDMAKGMSDQVRCHKCGATQKIDPVECLRRGWPKCCGATMNLDTRSANIA